jgi:hypothetical protein
MNDLMRRIVFLFTAIFQIISCLPGISGPAGATLTRTDDTIDIQTLYNGKAWRNLYYRVKGDQFLFTTEFMPGNATIHGKEFKNVKFKYDIYNDEVLTITDRGIIIEMNKEMLDLFSMKYNNQDYYFKRIDADSINSFSGYFNILYEGPSSLYIKYKKEILLLAVENKFDMFNQIDRIYLKKDGKIIFINSKKEFLGKLADHKQEVRSFIKTNRIRISKKDPESFRPVLEYYDKIRH